MIRSKRKFEFSLPKITGAVIRTIENQVVMFFLVRDPVTKENISPEGKEYKMGY